MAALAIAGIVIQAYLAGLAIFGAAFGLAMHRMLGGLVAIPILGLLSATLHPSGGTGWRGPARLLGVLYFVQLGLVAAGTAAGVSWIAALHPANALAMLLVAVEILRRNAALPSARATDTRN
ncbi:DUF6220 domain-containing protein [Hoeflea marina]|nr:DUF6220 domain-containing protein [Hoeflea marina]